MRRLILVLAVLALSMIVAVPAMAQGWGDRDNGHWNDRDWNDDRDRNDKDWNDDRDHNWWPRHTVCVWQPWGWSWNWWGGWHFWWFNPCWGWW
jgi:hypothetical protein